MLRFTRFLSFDNNIKLIMKKNSVAYVIVYQLIKKIFSQSWLVHYTQHFLICCKEKFYFRCVKYFASKWNEILLFVLFIYKLICDVTWNKLIKCKIYFFIWKMWNSNNFIDLNYKLYKFIDDLIKNILTMN